MPYYAHNRWSGIGRLGRDPESRYLADETPVTNFSIAVQQGDDVMWMSCTAFGKVGEIIRDYCTKGSQIYVAGPLRHAEWEGKDKKMRQDKQLTVREVELLSSKEDGGQKKDKPHSPAPSGEFPFE